MDCTLLYLRRNATITRQRRLKFTRAKTWRTSTPWKIAKLAAKYKRCEISANVRHCTRLELFKRCKFLEFRKSRSKISRHSPLNGKMILRRVFDRGILEQGVCGIDPRAKFPRREQDGRKWNDDIDGRDGFLLPADASRDQEAEEYARFSVQTPRWPKLTDWQTTSRHEPNQQQATPPPLSTREAWEALSYFAFFFFFFSFFSSPQLASTLASRRPTAGPRLFDSSARYAPNLRSEFSREARKIAVTPVLAFVCLFFRCRGKMLKGLGEIVEASFRRAEKGENVSAGRWKVLASSRACEIFLRYRREIFGWNFLSDGRRCFLPFLLQIGGLVDWPGWWNIFRGERENGLDTDTEET